MDFSKFDGLINQEQLQKDVKEAAENSNFEEVKKGVYTSEIEKLELGATKDGRPMLKAQFRILGDEDGNKCDFTKHCVFMNRVIYGTKNDANMIASAVGWVKSLEPSDEVGPIVFENYSQFSELILDVAEDVIGNVEYVIDYDKDAFNNISISQAYDK